MKRYSIENLKIVSRSENNLNRSGRKGIKYTFLDDIGDKVVVDEVNQIYYSKTNDKFYRFIPHTNMFREMFEGLNGKCNYMYYGDNEGKTIAINTTKFRENLQFASH